MNRYFSAMLPRPEPKLLVSFSIRLCIFAAAVSVAIFWMVRTTPPEYYLPLAWGLLLLVLAQHFGVWLWKRIRHEPQSQPQPGNSD
jgi:hypothetical protein